MYFVFSIQIFIWTFIHILLYKYIFKKSLCQICVNFSHKCHTLLTMIIGCGNSWIKYTSGTFWRWNVEEQMIPTAKCINQMWSFYDDKLSMTFYTLYLIFFIKADFADKDRKILWIAKDQSTNSSWYIQIRSTWNLFEKISSLAAVAATSEPGKGLLSKKQWEPLRVLLKLAPAQKINHLNLSRRVSDDQKCNFLRTADGHHPSSPKYHHHHHHHHYHSHRHHYHYHRHHHPPPTPFSVPSGSLIVSWC